MSGYQQPDDEAVVVARDIHVKADYLQVVKDQFMPGRTFLVSVCEHVGTRPIEAGVHMDEPRLRALIEDLAALLPEHTS